MNVFEVLPEPAASRLRDGKLAPLAQIYYDRLSALKYSPATIRSSLFSLAHFSLWARGRAFDLTSLDRHITCFLDRHLPRCTCAAPVLRSRHQLSAALGHLREVVRASGIGPEGPCVARDEAVLSRFDDYMSRARGLAASTRLRRVAIVRTLLCMPTSEITPTADELRAFLMREFSRISTASAGVTASTIRSYLLFRASEGDSVTHLLPVVAKPAYWRNSALPKTLAPDEIERLLGAFPSELPSRLRCYAIVRCLVDLGLRGCEVIALNLDNIDWRVGTVSIKKGKAQRSDVLPLPHATGAAIADYVRLERPLTTTRRIFVRHVAPVDKPVSTAVVRRAVREAYRRAGLPYTGVHVLRHTLARRMLNSGSTLKEIADVLRHRELDASRVYAKVDFDHLALVAMPWPGSAA